MTMKFGRGRKHILVLTLALVLPATAAWGATDVEALQAATVKITVEHDGGIEVGSGILLCQRGERVDILTAKHVMTGVGLVDESGDPGTRFHKVEKIEVAFHRDVRQPVIVQARDVQSAKYKDLAMVTLWGVGEQLSTARVGLSETLKLAQEVQAIGHHRGTYDRDWFWVGGNVQSVGEFIEYSAEIARGFSGGPLFDEGGAVVGINIQTLDGLVRAIPINEAVQTVRPWVDSRCLKPPPPEFPEEGKRDVRHIAGIEFAWRYIPSGSFQMGSPRTEKERADDETPREVTLPRGFWMGETEVTQKQWQAIMKKNPSKFEDCDECPVENVNWYEALAFANALSEQSKLEQCYELSGDNRKAAGLGLEYGEARLKRPDWWNCKGYRLPTEAEWEYAARARTTTPFWTGSILPARLANYDGTHPYPGDEKGENRKRTIKGQVFPNPWGLYEMHGNVWEWTSDSVNWDNARVTNGTKGVKNPLGVRGSKRVLRGGSWSHAAHRCRSANRFARSPGYRRDFIGFRLVRALP